MKKKIALFSILILLFLSSNSGLCCEGRRQPKTFEEKLAHFFQKNEVTVAITDSGLGGLAVMADAVERMKEAGIFKRVKIVFFNSLFSNELGYNSLKTHAEKVRIFDSALSSLEENYDPDLILIGCNTLSVIYEETLFSKKTEIPVVGIVDAGVELISENLKETPNSVVIIFATQTTVEEGNHKKKLVEQGFGPKRIITQPCSDLVNYIERGYRSDETEMLISACVDEALQKVQNPKLLLYVSLNCTHFGYSLDLWKKAFEAQGLEPLDFLNPNSKMIDFLFDPKRHKLFKRTEIQTRVVSMVEISREKIESIGEWLRKISPETASSLESYELKRNLFEWRKYIIK